MQMGRDPAAAEHHLRTILDLRPTFSMARRILGRLLLEQDRADEAVAELEILAHVHPWSFGSVVDYGIALLRADRPAEAEKALRRATLLDPADPDALYHLALAILAGGEDVPDDRRQEAAELLERALDLNPSHREARQVLDTLTGAE
jgi:tetratricopeptide (TPR) repeat protein